MALYGRIKLAPVLWISSQKVLDSIRDGPRIHVGPAYEHVVVSPGNMHTRLVTTPPPRIYGVVDTAATDLVAGLYEIPMEIVCAMTDEDRSPIYPYNISAEYPKIFECFEKAYKIITSS